jgi:hypothetical protein
MAKLAIIFGAGASYDFLPTYPPSNPSDHLRDYRIPLADQLFENRAEFADLASKLRRLRPILPGLRHRSGNRSVEEVLEELRSLEKNDPYWPRRQQELTSIRFYLQQAIWSSEIAMLGHAAGLSNYLTLIGYIEQFRRSKEPVIFITFNYDTLIERALSCHFDDFSFKAINDYIRRPNYKLFKLHGSVNWGNPIVEDARLDVRQPIERIRESLIDLSDSIQYDSDQFVVLNEPRVVVSEWVYVPAISIPVQTKSHFSCPREWLAPLETFLDGVSNLLVVGWRGSEEHFLKRAVPVLKKNADLQLSIVSAAEPSAKETQARLENAGLKPARVWIYLGGFTNFILSDDVKIFLRRGGNVV